MLLARKFRAAKPQVRRARRYCASELSFQPDCGSAKPERTHSRTSSRLMCAVGTRRWSAQYLATLVLPAPAGPMSRTASVVDVGVGRAGGGRRARHGDGAARRQLHMTGGVRGAPECCGPRGRAGRPVKRRGAAAGPGGGAAARAADAAVGRGAGPGCAPGRSRVVCGRGSRPVPDPWGCGGSDDMRASGVTCARALATGEPRGAGPAPAPVGRRQRRPHCVLHPVPLRLVQAIGAGSGAPAPLPTERYRPRPPFGERPGTARSARAAQGRSGTLPPGGATRPLRRSAARSTAGSGPSRTVGLARPSRTMKRSRSPRDFLSTFMVSSSLGHWSSR